MTTVQGTRLCYFLGLQESAKQLLHRLCARQELILCYTCYWIIQCSLNTYCHCGPVCSGQNLEPFEPLHSTHAFNTLTALRRFCIFFCEVTVQMKTIDGLAVNYLYLLQHFC